MSYNMNFYKFIITSNRYNDLTMIILFDLYGPMVMKFNVGLIDLVFAMKSELDFIFF